MVPRSMLGRGWGYGAKVYAGKGMGMCPQARCALECALRAVSIILCVFRNAEIACVDCLEMAILSRHCDASGEHRCPSGSKVPCL